MPYTIRKEAGEGEEAWVLKDPAGAPVLKLRFALLPEGTAAEAAAAAAAATATAAVEEPRNAKRPRLDQGAVDMGTVRWDEGGQAKAQAQEASVRLHPAAAALCSNADEFVARRAEGAQAAYTGRSMGLAPPMQVDVLGDGKTRKATAAAAAADAAGEVGGGDGAAALQGAAAAGPVIGR